jgi:hypothetical protein
MRVSHASRVTKNVLVLHHICGGEYTLIFVTVCFVWDFGQTTDRMCGSLQLLGGPKVFCCLEAFLGRCPIVMYNIVCSWKTEVVNTLSSVCASCIIGVVK